MGVTITGLNEYIRSLERLSSNAEEAEKRAVYKGAGIVADAVKAGLKTIPSTPAMEYGTASKPVKTISNLQKSDLIKGLGIAPMSSGGDIDTHVGFDGYGSVKTKKYPQGQPIAMLARAITSGTSFRVKNPVIRTSAKKAKAKAIEAMKTELEKEIERSVK